MSKYQKLEKQWKKLALIMMPIVTIVNLFVNFSEMSSPRDALERFNWPEVVL